MLISVAELQGEIGRLYAHFPLCFLNYLVDFFIHSDSTLSTNNCAEFSIVDDNWAIVDDCSKRPQ